MELKELTEKTLALFAVSDPNDLGSAVLRACDASDKLRKFRSLVAEDLSKDWMQRIYASVKFYSDK